MSLKEQLLKCGVGELYHGATLDNYNGDPTCLPTIREYVGNFKKARETGIGLYLFGPNGTGKTWLACSILISAIQTEKKKGLKYTVFKTSLSQIVTAMTKGWYSDTDRLAFQELIMNRDFLYIDDLEKGMVGEGKLQKAALDMILRERVERLRPTLFSSNEEPKIMNQLFGPSIGSLMANSVMIVPVKGDDYRKNVNTAKRRWNENLPSGTNLL